MVRTAVDLTLADVDDPDRHLSVETLRADLGGTSVRSGFIQIGAQSIQLALNFGSGMALARLLVPEDFGLLAMVSSLTALVIAANDFGFAMAAVHREQVDHGQVSALFWVSLKLNALTVLLVACMAPVLAWFYGEERLVAITLAMTLGIFVLGLTTQHQSLLIRQMRFGHLRSVEVGSQLAGIVVGVATALLGAGYWALVYQFLTASVSKSAAMWLVSGWRPARYRGAAGARAPEIGAMLSYGAHLTGFRIISEIGRNLDRVLVGYFSGATAAGLYDNSYRWSLYPVQQIYLPITSVAVAGLSRVQDQPAVFRAWCRAGLLPVFSVAMPALTFMFVEARGVILVLLGEQWLAAVPLFRVLCIAAFASSMTSATRWLYLSLGETKRQFHWSLIYTPVMVIAVSAGVSWGPYGVAIGFTVGTCLLTYPSIAFCLKTSYLSIGNFFSIAARPALASFGAAALLAAGEPWLTGNGLVVDMSTKCVAFGVAYLIIWAGAPGGKGAVADVWRLVRIVLPKS